MKKYWPFGVALGIVVVLVGAYLLDWIAAAWTIAVVLILFPLIYVGVAIFCLDVTKTGKGPPPHE